METDSLVFRIAGDEKQKTERVHAFLGTPLTEKAFQYLLV